jgi:hypothetical protein
MRLALSGEPADFSFLQHGDAERHIRQQKSGKVPKAK